VADQILPLNAGSGGLNLDVEELTVGANTVERQRGQIAGSGAAEVARVINTQPAGTEYGLVTRPATTEVTASGTLNALNAAGTITTNGFNGVGMQLASGTFKGTLVPEVTTDGGTTWIASYFVDPTTCNVTTSFVTSATNNPATTRSIILPAGAGQARVRVSAFTSGTASVTLRATVTTQPLFPFATSPGATAPPVVAALGGVDISISPNLTRALQCATDGSLFVNGSVTAAGSIGANGVPIFGKDTSNNAQYLRVDTSGNQILGNQTAISNNGIGSVSLGTSLGKVNKSKSGSLASSATTAAQTIVTYTVTSGKVLYLQYFDVGARLTTWANTATYYGTVSLVIGGTTMWTQDLMNAGVSSPICIQLGEPIAVAASTVVSIVCTPAAATAYTWTANLGGYEK
jgi:hypothetical protein